MSSSTIPTIKPNWLPFRVEKKQDVIRSLDTLEGIIDRLRVIAFAEKQALEGYQWALNAFDISKELSNAWSRVLEDEKRHLGLLCDRIQTLSQESLENILPQRAVSDRLWDSYMQCHTVNQFALFMATAEKRGEAAGQQLFELLVTHDATTAQLILTIAKEERFHIETAKKFFPELENAL